MSSLVCYEQFCAWNAPWSVRPSVRPSVQIACEQHICRTVGVTITKFGMKLEGHELLT